MLIYCIFKNCALYETPYRYKNLKDDKNLMIIMMMFPKPTSIVVLIIINGCSKVYSNSDNSIKCQNVMGCNEIK